MLQTVEVLFHVTSIINDFTLLCMNSFRKYRCCILLLLIEHLISHFSLEDSEYEGSES